MSISNNESSSAADVSIDLADNDNDHDEERVATDSIGRVAELTINDNNSNNNSNMSNNVSPLEDIARRFQSTVPIKDTRRYRARLYRKTFVGSDAVSTLQELLQEYYINSNANNDNRVVTRSQATALGIYLMHKYQLFAHVSKSDHHVLYDDYYFYKFARVSVDLTAVEEEDLSHPKESTVTTATTSSSRMSLLSQFSSSSSSSSLLPSPLQRRRRLQQQPPPPQTANPIFSATDDQAFLERLLSQSQESKRRNETDDDDDDETNENETKNEASTMFQKCVDCDKLRAQARPTQRFDEVAALTMMADDVVLEHGKDVHDDDDGEDDDGDESIAVSTLSSSARLEQQQQQQQQLHLDRRLSRETLKDPAKLQEAAVAFELGMEVGTHRFHGRPYPDTFVGTDAVDFLVASGWACTREGAVAVGRAVAKQFDLFEHVTKEHVFQDDYYFYRFIPGDKRKGMYETSNDTFSSADTAILAASSKVLRRNKKKTLEEIAIDFEQSIKVEDRRFHLKTYKQCFIARDAVSFLVGGLYVASRTDAVQLGQRLEKELDLFEHVTKQHTFEDDYLFFRFKEIRLRDLKEGFLSDEQSLPEPQECLDLERLATEFRKNVTTTTNTYHLKRYKQTFIGSDAVDYLVNSSNAKTRKDAVLLGRELEEKLSLFRHVKGDHPFKDDHLFYRYNDKEFATSLSSLSTSSEKLDEIAEALKQNLDVKTRRYYHKVYKDCFLGSDAVSYLVEAGYAPDRSSAVELGRDLANFCHLFEHVERDHELKDEELFYRFLYTEDNSPILDLDTDALRPLARQLVNDLKVSSHRYRLRVYKDTFSGEEAVSFMVSSGMAATKEEAVALGKQLQSTFNLFEHVTRDHGFENKFLFYRFIPEGSRRLWEELSVEEELDELVFDSTWDRKLAAFGKRATERRLDSAGMLSLSSRLNNSIANLVDIKDIRLKVWLAEFRRLDPRWRILSFFVSAWSEIVRFYSVAMLLCVCACSSIFFVFSLQNEVAQLGGENVSDISLGNVHPLLWFLTRSSVFSVWRPTAYVAIRRMMLGEAVGKGLNIKGKSAKRGKNSGFVPYLQIGDNKHKDLCRTIHKHTKIRLFFPSGCFHSRDEVVEYLESVAEEMIAAVNDAKRILTDVSSDSTAIEQAKETMLWDVPDLSITYLDDYSPSCYGIEIPSRLFWEALVVRQDCYRKPGSQYDVGRASLAAFQDMNNATLQFPSKDSPRAVLWQNACSRDPLNIHELLMAYEEKGRVRPVVSDFDPFLVGTRRVRYDPKDACLPTEQVDVLKWCVKQIGGILDGPTRPETWTNRWLEVLKRESNNGFHPSIPPYGFGDIKSYSIMRNAIERLTADGSVRHGAESFNYYFPQDLDDKYLVVSDRLDPVPWRYMDDASLRAFLMEQVDMGYTFPLNPKWILCDPGWKALYDKLLSSDQVDIINSMKIWFPPESGVREEIEEICSRNPEGFMRGLRQ